MSANLGLIIVTSEPVSSLKSKFIIYFPAKNKGISILTNADNFFHIFRGIRFSSRIFASKSSTIPNFPFVWYRQLDIHNENAFSPRIVSIPSLFFPFLKRDVALPCFTVFLPYSSFLSPSLLLSYFSPFFARNLNFFLCPPSISKALFSYNFHGYRSLDSCLQ